jgi:hypothetical protein
MFFFTLPIKNMDMNGVWNKQLCVCEVFLFGVVLAVFIAAPKAQNNRS